MEKPTNIGQIFAILACPGCKSAVDTDWEASFVTCPNCGKQYEVREGIPIMLDEESKREIKAIFCQDRDSRRMQRDFTESWPLLEKFYKVLQPPRPRVGLDKENKFKVLLDGLGGSALCLELGSGKKRIGEGFINLDIASFPNVDVVGVGEKLPFLDNVFEMVVSQAVLEHARYPSQMVAEMYRVLKPGGYVWGDVAFMQPYHGFPAHYQNYTILGIQELFSQFEVVEVGVVDGPSEALSFILKTYAGLFSSKQWIRIPLNLLMDWVTFSVRYLDLYLRSRPDAHRVATSLYFIGRKR